MALGDLAGGPYPSPGEAVAEMSALAAAHPNLCRAETIGRSTEGRPIEALRLSPERGENRRPRLLVTAHIHAVEYIGAYVARALTRRLLEGYGREAECTALLDAADIWVVPMLNPDGAERVWRRNGWVGLGGSRFTANGVDPNRNFPVVAASGRRGWNSGTSRPGSAYYRGPRPLSEPECLALAQLCRRERFCAAINFHSFGGVVFMPIAEGAGDAARIRDALDTFDGAFQSRQPHLRYRPIRERSAAIEGQLDPFLLNAFGTVSVTVEVSRPGWYLLLPWRALRLFWWANPLDPDRWAENDVDAAIHALAELLRRTNGEPCAPAHPELARSVE